MKNKVNRNLDLIKLFALCMVIIYHLFSVLEFRFHGVLSFFNPFIKFGGEFTTLFFIISGYGIYYSIKNQISRDKHFDFSKFINRRFRKLLPLYIFSIVIACLFMTHEIVFRRLDIVTHLLFIHNFFPDTHGNISGVLWTMAVFFQFYFIAYFMYKCVKKYPKSTYIFAVIFSVLFKYAFYHFILPGSGFNEINYYFIYGKQIFGVLDSFVIGMLLARICEKKRNISPLCFCISVLATGALIYYASNRGIYFNNIFSCIFNSIFSLALAVNVYLFMNIEINYDSAINKFLLFISKYEYSIYLWHLLIFENLIANSQFIMSSRTSVKMVMLVLIAVSYSIVIAIIFGKFFDNYDYSWIGNFFRKNRKKIFMIVLVFIAVFAVFTSSGFIVQIAFDCNKIASNNIERRDNLKGAVSTIKNKIKKKRYNYIVVDKSSEEGYMNFFRFRYYLSPSKNNTYYNEVVDVFYDGSVSDRIKFIKEKKFDYIIFHDYKFIEKKVKNKNKDHVYIYSINKNSKEYNSLENLLIPLNGGDLK